MQVLKKYLHAIANPKDRLADREDCRVKPGGVFGIYRIRSPRDDNGTVGLNKTVSESAPTVLFYTQSMFSDTTKANYTDERILSYFWYIVTDLDFIPTI